MRALVPLAIGAALALPARGEQIDLPAVFVQANASYQSGEYAKAAEAYRRIVEAGIDSADVFYNLGTAELKAGRRGHAIVAFERALRLDPQDTDAAFNLAEALKGNIDKVVGTREEEPLLERIGARVPAEAAGHVFLGAWVAALVFLALRIALRRAKGFFSTLGFTALAVAIVSGLALAAAAWQRTQARHAVVVAAVTPVREGPADDFKPAFEIHEGLKVRVVRQDSDYLRIRLPNGVEGWVAARDVPVI